MESGTGMEPSLPMERVLLSGLYRGYLRSYQRATKLHVRILDMLLMCL